MSKNEVIKSYDEDSWLKHENRHDAEYLKFLSKSEIEEVQVLRSGTLLRIHTTSGKQIEVQGADEVSRTLRSLGFNAIDKTRSQKVEKAVIDRG